MAGQPAAGNRLRAHPGCGSGVSGRAFVTGVTGFVGSALAGRLVEHGWRVTGLARRSSAPVALAWLLRRGVTLVQGDVTRAAELAPAFAGADVVFHCAAVIGYRRRLRGLMQRVNVLGTQHVVDGCLAADIGRLVHVSSIAAVGVTREPRLLDEDAPWNGDELDAAYYDTKHEAEQRVLAGVARGLDATIVNPAAIYGPSVVPSNSGSLVVSIARGRLRGVPRGGINVVPLETVVDGLLAAAARGRRGRRIILGGENLGMSELVQRVSAAAGRQARPIVLPDGLGPVARVAMELVEPFVPETVRFTPELCAMFGRWMWYSTERMRRELDVQPAPLDPCFERTVERLRRDGRLPS